MEGALWTKEGEDVRIWAPNDKTREETDWQRMLHCTGEGSLP